MNPEVEKLVTIGKLTATLGKSISELEAGTFCHHKSWGIGKVAEWDLPGGRIIIDFEDKPHHGMNLEFAVKSLETLPESHILSRRLEDKDALIAMAKADPAALVELALESYGRSMSMDVLDDLLKDHIIPEGRYKNWWDSTKKILRQHTKFIVPSKRNVPLELRADDLSTTDALVSDFTKAADAKAKAKVVDSIIKEFESFESPEKSLKAVAGELEQAIAMSVRLQPAAALELIFVRDQLYEKAPSLRPQGDHSAKGAREIIQQNRPGLPEIIRALPVAAQRRVVEALPEAFGDEWVDEALNQMNRGGVRTVTELARFLNAQSRADELHAYLQLGLAGRMLSSEVLVWVCKERKGAAKAVFDPDLASAIINALEKDHYDDESTRSNKLHDAVLNDPNLVPELAELSNKNQIRTFARRLLMSPVFEELNKRSLLARIIKVHPEVQELVEGGDQKKPEGQEPLVVSFASLEDRRKKYEHLVKDEIPKNTEDIKIAREYGDLSENFEFKSSKEQQRVLMRRKSELERDLSRAVGTDFSDASTDKVSIGTIVDVERVDTGESETFTILGAWDSVPEQGIISYLSSTGNALLGRSRGDTLELATEDGTPSTIRINSIRKYHQGS